MHELAQDEDFTSFVSKYKFVVVDFFATWCGPCKKLGPQLDEFLKGFDTSKVAGLKVDVDVHEEVSSTHKVEALPTVVLYVDGKVSEHRFQGASKKMFEVLAELLSDAKN